MYNTTEVMILNIEKIDFKYMKRQSFIATDNENVKHVKILPWISVVQSEEGSYDIALGSGEMQKTGGGGFFVAPSGVQQTIVHHLDKKSGVMRCRWVFFDLLINDAYRFDLLYDLPVTLEEPARSQMNEVFDELFASTDAFSEYECYYRILKLLFSISSPRELPHQEAMQETLSYISENRTKRITVSDLASHIHMSPSNFYSVFKKAFGLSPMAYVSRYRLSLAAEYLHSSDLTVSEIADLVGIPDPLYFSRMFKRSYSVSPMKYRAEYKSRFNE